MCTVEPARTWRVVAFCVAVVAADALSGYALDASGPPDTQKTPLVVVSGMGRVAVAQIPGLAGGFRLTRYDQYGAVARSFEIRAVTYDLATAYGHGSRVVLVTGPNPSYIICVVDLVKESAIATFLVHLLSVSPSGRYFAYSVPTPRSTALKADDKLMISDMWPDGVAAGAHVPSVIYQSGATPGTVRSEAMIVPQWLDDNDVAFAVTQDTGNGRPGMAVACADLSAGIRHARTVVKALEMDRVVDQTRLDSLDPEAPGVVIQKIERVGGLDGMVLRLRFGAGGAPLVPSIDVRVW